MRLSRDSRHPESCPKLILLIWTRSSPAINVGDFVSLRFGPIVFRWGHCLHLSAAQENIFCWGHGLLLSAVQEEDNIFRWGHGLLLSVAQKETNAREVAQV